MARRTSWDAKIAGDPYILAEGRYGGRAIRLGGAPKEPGTVGQIDTIPITTLHHGYNQLIARDPARIQSSLGLDVTMAGVMLPAGAKSTIYVGGATDDFYDEQGGGAIMEPSGGDPSNEVLAYLVTAKRIFQVTPSTEAVVEKYALDDTKYAFTGSACKHEDSIYFPYESNEDESGRGRWGTGAVRFQPETDTWSVVTGYPVSHVFAAKGKIWWVRNRGALAAPNAYWTDDPNFPADPVPDGQTYSIADSAEDGMLQRSGASYPPTSTQAFGTALHCGQYLSGGIYYVKRGYLAFDTSALPEDCTVTSATLRIFLKVKHLDTAFVMQVRKYAWSSGGLETGDWREAPGNDPLLGSKASSTFPAINNWLEILLNVDQIEKDGNTEVYLVSDRDVAGTAPSDDEYAEFEDFNDGGGHEAELVIEYTTPGTMQKAGPFPIPSGGYCTWMDVMGQWLAIFKQDGQIYGMDEDGVWAPISPEGFADPDFRFGHGTLHYGHRMVIPHKAGLKTLEVPSLEMADIHPQRLNEGYGGVFGGVVGAAARTGARLVIGQSVGQLALISMIQPYRDGDFYSLYHSVSVVSKPKAMAVTQLADGSFSILVLSESGGRAFITRLYLCADNWIVRPKESHSGGIVNTSVYLGDGLASLVTKRFVQVRGWAQECDANNYYSFGFQGDGGTPVSLGTVNSNGPFALAFPGTAASLGRGVSLTVTCTCQTTGKPRLELPLFIDFEYVPSETDSVWLGVLATDEVMNRLGGVWKRKSAQDMIDALRALQGTVTTVQFPHQSAGSAWNVLVEKVGTEEIGFEDAGQNPETMVGVLCRRL